MTKYKNNKTMKKLVRQRSNKKIKRRENTKSEQQKNKKSHQSKDIKVYRFHPKNFINPFLEHLNITKDYDLYQILDKVMEKNVKAYTQGTSQSEVVIIKTNNSLKPNKKIYLILVAFTILEKEDIEQNSTYLAKETLQALNEKKKYISFQCRVNTKHSFNTEINKVLNTETKLYYNLKKIYNRIFFPADIVSPYILENLLFNGVITQSNYMLSFKN